MRVGRAVGPVLMAGVGLAVAVAAHGLNGTKDVYNFTNSRGESVGTVTFTQKTGGPVTMKVQLKDMPFGDHGVHIHQNAVCDAPDFKGAGSHFNPDGKQHGFKNPDGHHNGDTPGNISVSEDRTGEATFRLTSVTLDPAAPNSIFANGGTSVVVHENADDMKTDPSGNSGSRIACAVIKQ